MDDVIFSKTFKWVDDFMAGGGGRDRFGRIIVGIVNGFSVTATTTTMAFRNVTDRQRNSRMGALFDTIVFTISCPHKKKKTPISRSFMVSMHENEFTHTISDGCGHRDSCFTPCIGLALKSTFAPRHSAECAMGSTAIRSKALETETVAG